MNAYPNIQVGRACNALLALVFKTVCEKAEVDVVQSFFCRGLFNLGDLVLEDAFTIVKESAD